MYLNNFSIVTFISGAFLIVLFYLFVQRKQKRVEAAVAAPNLFAELTQSLNKRNGRIKVLWFFAGLFFCGVALMRPQWGFHWEEAERSGLDILIALDTSRSMLAEDMQPTRLAYAKGAVKDFAKRLKGDRVGLVAFAGRAFLLCPLTTDYSAFIQAVDDLDITTIPRGGTSMVSAISESLKSYGRGGGKYKVLILLTDGEDHEGDPVAVAELAHKQGIIIFCVGIGKESGELIPIVDPSGHKEFLKDERGQVIKSHLRKDRLQQIASIAGGSYVTANEIDAGLNWIYKEKLSKMEKGEFEGQKRKRYREWFQIPLTMALFLLILEPWIDERKR